MGNFGGFAVDVSYLQEGHMRLFMGLFFMDVVRMLSSIVCIGTRFLSFAKHAGQ